MANSWKTFPSDFSLLGKEAHVWRAELDLSISSTGRFSQTLSIDESARAEKFHFDKDRKLFIVRRGILRSILGLYLRVRPSELQFCYGSKGKPALADINRKESIRFNVSHSNGVALFAFAQGSEIGVDIEYMHDISGMNEIAEEYFSKEENDILGSLPESRKKEGFFNYWTRKEAFTKAVGDGLYQRLDMFDVALKPGEAAGLIRIGRDSKRPSRWFIRDLKVAPGFIAALAIEGQDWGLHYWQWSDRLGK